MFKQILVPATGTAADAAVFQTALLAARPFGAHLEFLHIRIDSADVAVAMTAGGIGLGAETASLVARIEAQDDTHEQKAWQEFTAFCTRTGIPTGGSAPGAGLCADMLVETGHEAQWLSEYGRFADLIVIGRKREEDDVTIDLLDVALMNTGRPLLIAPARAPSRLLETIVIAWTDTPETMRAIASAMPLIDHAGRVVILSVQDDGTSGEAAGESTAERLLRGLRWHNPNVTIHSVAAGDRAAAAALLDTAGELEASLLIMGGYGHSRLREGVFGGTTLSILKAADLPVLMAH
jgi:nucleotide-binding universal stress UspA family protein